MRKYRKTQRQLIERRAFLKGTEVARIAGIRTFQELGNAQLNGNAAAEILKRLSFT